MVIVSTILVSCQPKGVIPQSKLVDILSDIYIVDAFIEKGPSLQVYGEHSRDSVSVYKPILAKYGYNMDDFRKSMIYYAEKNDGLQNIYKEVKEKISNKVKEYEPEARIEALSKNFWTNKNSMLVDIDSLFRRIEFKVDLKDTGVYRISADIRFFKSDSIKNPRMLVWLAKSKSDSAYNKQEIVLQKDSAFNSYSFDIAFESSEFSLLKGYWLDYDTVNVKRVNLSNKAIRERKKKMGKKYKDSINGRQHFELRNMSILYDFEASQKLMDSISASKKSKD